MNISIHHSETICNSLRENRMCSRNVGKQIRRNIGKILLQA